MRGAGLDKDTREALDKNLCGVMDERSKLKTIKKEIEFMKKVPQFEEELEEREKEAG